MSNLRSTWFSRWLAVGRHGIHSLTLFQEAAVVIVILGVYTLFFLLTH